MDYRPTDVPSVFAAMRTGEEYGAINKLRKELEEWNEAATASQIEAAQNSTAVGEAGKED